MFWFVDGMYYGESVGIHVFRIAITCKFSFFIYHLSHSNCIACNNHVSLLTINNSFFCVYIQRVTLTVLFIIIKILMSSTFNYYFTSFILKS